MNKRSLDFEKYVLHTTLLKNKVSKGGFHSDDMEKNDLSVNSSTVQITLLGKHKCH